MSTTVPAFTRKAEERILAGVHKSHETILEAAGSIAKPIERVVPVGPKLSLPKGVPTTQAVVDNAFSFTLELIEAQRAFAQSLFATASPVLKKLTGNAPEPARKHASHPEKAAA